MRTIINASILILLFSLGCQEKYTPLEFDYYFDDTGQSEILAQIISYVYATPGGIPKADRFNKDYREIYKKELQKFEMIHFWKSDEGTYFFYMLRPARNINNNKRGVAGIFTLDENLEIDSFKEVFVTKMIPKEQVVSFGNLVFQNFIDNNGEIPMTPLRQDLIEFPNTETRYDPAIHEWTYSLK
jgi:hypothetical protein